MTPNTRRLVRFFTLAPLGGFVLGLGLFSTKGLLQVVVIGMALALVMIAILGTAKR